MVSLIRGALYSAYLFCLSNSLYILSSWLNMFKTVSSPNQVCYGLMDFACVMLINFMKNNFDENELRTVDSNLNRPSIKRKRDVQLMESQIHSWLYTSEDRMIHVIEELTTEKSFYQSENNKKSTSKGLNKSTNNNENLLYFKSDDTFQINYPDSNMKNQENCSFSQPLQNFKQTGINNLKNSQFNNSSTMYKKLNDVTHMKYVLFDNSTVSLSNIKKDHEEDTSLNNLKNYCKTKFDNIKPNLNFKWKNNQYDKSNDKNFMKNSFVDNSTGPIFEMIKDRKDEGALVCLNNNDNFDNLSYWKNKFDEVTPHRKNSKMFKKNNKMLNFSAKKEKSNLIFSEPTNSIKERVKLDLDWESDLILSSGSATDGNNKPDKKLEYHFEFDGSVISQKDGPLDSYLLPKFGRNQEERRRLHKEYFQICRSFKTNSLVTVHGKLFYLVIGSKNYLLTEKEFKNYLDVVIPSDHTTKLMFTQDDPRIKLMPP